MPITLTTRRTALALGAVLLLGTSTAAFAYDYGANDDPAQTQSQIAATTPASDENGITHITGGVGDDEREAMEAVKGQYNVHITNSNKDGAFNDLTAIVITDAKGRELVTADAGPLFYVELPAGSYTIEAQHRDREQSKKIKIGKGKKASDIHFVW